MKLYTIINDKTKWSNELSGGVFSVENYTKEQADEFLKSVDGYILKENYSWETEYDDYDDKSRGGDTYYHKINVDELLICDNKVVGVIPLVFYCLGEVFLTLNLTVETAETALVG